MKLTIRMKLMASFLMIVVFLIVISLNAIFRMDGMGEKSKEINDSWLPSVALMGQLNGDVSDVQRLMLKLILEHETSEVDQIESQLNATLDSIKKVQEQYEPLLTTEEEKQIYQSFAKNYNAYIRSIPRIIESGKNNNFHEANMLQNELHPLWQGANNAITQLIDLNKKGAENASAQSVQLSESGKSFAVILSLIGIVIALIISFVISQLISKPIIALTQSAERIADGDLTVDDIKLKYRDELGQLSKSFNLMKHNLRHLIQQANSSAEHVAAASEELTASSEQTAKATEQIATSMQEVSIGAENQVRGVTESSTAMNEISVGIQQIASRTQQVSTSANVTSEKATIGNKSIQTAVEQMKSINETVTSLSVSVKELGESSQEIGKIVDVITSIASQTNLLSLNAAIEAARAGEHGRGFAVVADEVRKLAEQSARSSEQISQLIAVIKEETNRTVHSMDSVINEVAQGIGVVNEAGHSFEQIRSSIDEVTMQIQEVSAAIQQMSAGSEQVVESIHMISSIAEESSAETHNVSAAAEQQLATMEEISASANSLAQMSAELQLLIGKFKV